MAYYNEVGNLVAPACSGQVGIDRAAEINTLHLPEMHAQMIKPNPNTIVCPIELKAAREAFVLLALRATSLSADERVEFRQAMIRFYNLSPDDAKRTIMVVSGINRERACKH